MGLRLSTAMTLVLSVGLLAACGEDEAEVEVEESEAEVVVEEEVAEAEEVVVEEEAVVEEEVAEVEADAEEGLVVEEEVAEAEVEEDDVIAEAGGAEPVELDTTVESDGEPITATAGAEAEADADVEVAEADTAVTADEETQEQLAEDAAADEGDAEVEIVEEGSDVELAEADADATAGTQSPSDEVDETVAEVQEATQGGTTEEVEGTDDDLLTLDTNVTVIDDGDDTTDQDVAQATGTESAIEGGTDAEAQVADDATGAEQVEETNDVATDGVDSGSEANMVDLDNLVLDDAGVQRLTEFVESSEEINDSQKVTIVAGLDAARDNPERLEELLEQVRELTGQ